MSYLRDKSSQYLILPCITEFWSTENEYDQAQLIVLRVLYSLRLSLHYSTLFNVALFFSTILLGVPLIVIMTWMLQKAKKNVQRKIDFWTNITEIEKLMKCELLEFKKKQKKMEEKRDKKLLKKSQAKKMF